MLTGMIKLLPPPEEESDSDEDDKKDSFTSVSGVVCPGI
jgi:hypothetical protein